MKIAHKVGLAAAAVLFITTSLLSLVQISQVRSSLNEQTESSIKEASGALARQIENWLNGKLQLIDMMAQSIDSQFSAEQIQRVFDQPILKQQFLLIFGGLDTDGERITNDPSWNPPGWDARQRPWYPVAKSANQAMLTEPYPDAGSGEILISAVAKLRDQGQFKGAFGGDISLKTISDTINTLNFNGAGYAFLLARNGNIISHPNTELNGKPIGELFDGQTPALKQDLSAIRGDGENLLVSFTPLSNLTGMDWYIGVVLDESKVLAEANALSWRAATGTLIGVALSLLLLGALMAHLLRPLSQLQNSLRDINSGDGDLTRRLPAEGDDEIASVEREFNGFLQNLQGLIGDVMGSSRQVRESTSLTSIEADQASGRLQEQLQELDQLATAMQEMASTAEEVARNAQAAAQAAVAANDETENGVAVVSQSTAAIKRLADEMNDTSQSINELAKLSHNIESILSVITSIADQTNLLALNAAIEAARAGESGRGFAVVADEVRSLASRTQQSTQEIRQMIDQLQSGVKQAEARMQQSRDTASQTAEEASAANLMLGRIREAITRINDMNLQIATAAEEQSATTEEINRNTTNIRDISHEVANGAEQQVRQCAVMVDQVGQQDRLLGRFKV
ncbi:methyl-accepting chemotaxis protein [Pseudomonas benzenivorans]|uniref:Methyl-accepting chemotaxis protein n=2 Tax=Pseudomonas benzenivorans TaxID=556533 RepID=A0ABY5H7I2_9PSED|nr:methyl-accepting chemotaxis protein [Pseudomonas benzenivorans]UTW08266.1 methyl-accepting chemotaxis protein [Pseudomonas benzenivorans]